MTTLPLRRSGAGMWGAMLLVGAGLAAGVAFAPQSVAIGGLALAAAAVLVRQLGLRVGMWCLFVGTIPLRQPMSIDVVGTASLFANDLLVFALAGVILYERGVVGIWRRSSAFRIGSVILALSLLGLYSATRLFWAVAILLTIAGQLAAFYVAWHVVRDARTARLTLVAFLIGLLPAIVVGLHQTTLDVQEFEQSNWSVPAVAWDAQGVPRIRAFGTYDHPLRFSHNLSVGIGAALGLAFAARGATSRLALFTVAALLAYANQYTYSIGGVLGSAAGFLGALLASGRKRVVLLVPLVVIGWMLVTPATFINRIEGVLTGRNTSAAARIITYHQTFRVLQDHPVLGVGWGSIRTALEDDYRISRNEAVSFTAENYFLQRGLALGAVGIVLVLAACVLFFRNAWARFPPGAASDWPRAAILAAGVAFYVQAQFIPAADATSRYTLWILFALAERMRIASRDPDGSA